MDVGELGTELITTPRPARFCVDDFLALDRAGAFADHAKSELIDGTILVVDAQFSRHVKAKVRLLRRRADACDALGTGLEAWSEGSVAMGTASMPEPDIFVTTTTPTDGAIPVSSVALIVEIADTAQAFDLEDKALLYARHVVPEYWVVDVADAIVDRMWGAGPQGYAYRDERGIGAVIEAATIVGLAVETGALG